MSPQPGAIPCHWCPCEAITSRDGWPACYWHADRELDGTPCSVCGEGAIEPESSDPEGADAEAGR